MSFLGIERKVAIVTGSGGGRPDRRGFFVEPTQLVDVDPRSTIAQKEIFGPVCCMIPYQNDDDAVRITNDSIYGLSGSIQSASEEHLETKVMAIPAAS